MPSKSGTVFISVNDLSSVKSEDKSKRMSSPLKREGSVEKSFGSFKEEEDAFLLKNEEMNKLNELERRASMVLFEARSQKPFFSRYRDEITICLNRVTLSRGGKHAGEEYPMPIENITSARVYRRFRLATLDIDTFGIEKPDPITAMKVDDARLARRYILALIECKKANIDLAGLNIEEVRKKLKNIGMVRYSSYDEKYHEL